MKAATPYLGGLLLVLCLCDSFCQVEVNKCCPLGRYYDIKTDKCLADPTAGEVNERHWVVPFGLNYTMYSDALNFSVIHKGPLDCPGPIESHEIQSQNPSNKFYFTSSGILIELNGPDLFVNHEKHHFCIDPRNKSIVIRFCPPRCNDGDLCVRKCCPAGEMFAYDDVLPYFCIPTTDELRVPSFLGPSKFLPAPASRSIAPRIFSGHYDLFYSNATVDPSKVSSRWVGADVRKPFSLLHNGTPTFFHPRSKSWKPFGDLEDYCYEHLDYPTDDGCNETEVLFMRKTNVVPAVESRTLHQITLTVAIICLLVATIVLTLLIERTNLHSWTRLSYVVSHLLFMVLFGFTYFEWLSPFTRPKVCVAFAIIFHFIGLSTICWLSVMNFDLWWTFRALKPTGDRRRRLFQYLMYCLFTVGTPAFIIAVASIMQYTKPPRKDMKYCLSALEDSEEYKRTFASHEYLYPDYGKKENRRCTLSSASMPVYWYGPMSFLLIWNLVFFLATSYSLIRYQRRARRASTESTNGGAVQAKLFVKIFIVSGITWNTEILSWLAADGTWLWVDILHHLQAIALFVIFVCKLDTIRNLRSRYQIFNKMMTPASRTSRSATLGSLSTELTTRVGYRKQSIAGSDPGAQAATLQKFENLEMTAHDVLPPPPHDNPM